MRLAIVEVCARVYKQSTQINLRHMLVDMWHAHVLKRPAKIYWIKRKQQKLSNNCKLDLQNLLRGEQSNNNESIS